MLNKIQIKTIIWCHYTSIRIAKIKKNKNTKSGQVFETVVTLICCCQELEIGTTTLENSVAVLIKLNTPLLCYSESCLMPQLELTAPSSRSPLPSLGPLLSHLHSALGKCYYLCSWLLVLWAPSGRRVELGQSPKHGGQVFNVHQVKLGFSGPEGSFLSSSRAAVIYRCIHSEVGLQRWREAFSMYFWKVKWGDDGREFRNRG